MNVRAKVAVAVVALLASHDAAFFIGARGAVARGAYVSSIGIRQEEKCWSTKNIECYRANWHLRAAATAGSANVALANPVPSGVNRELEEYLGWYEKLTPYVPPAK